jgi:type I restriction enzyme M protein
MDSQTEELGGKATFFTGEFKQYAWSRLLDHKLSGYERLLLYAEGIEKMNINENIPQLFRDIFKGAFLPYRDPETLNLFLKEINGFTYDHSERLGDAFEYLLSVLSSQGDAGQFRTPRHIIDFIVKIVNPTKEDTVLDPACGTAGFLISSYKHILSQNTKNYPGDLLTADDKGRLMTNFCGYDISPDMVRLSLVNMYLHGFAKPEISEYDALTSEDRWDERYDVIMANPPFMTPKGGIRPHSRFVIKAKRSEVLFVDYIAEHLNVHGKAGVIVPEGIIFQSQNAYKNLRKMLLAEGYLYAVISLPAGVFQPYAGVKTSILLMDKTLAKKTAEILFVKIANDGFDLGAQRRPIDKNDLPQALEIVKAWKQAIVERRNFELDEVDKAIAHIVSKEKIAESGDYNLSGDRYKEVISYANVKWPMVELGEVAIEIKSGFACGKSDKNTEGIPHLRPMNISSDGQLVWEGTKYISREELKDKSDYNLRKGDVLFNNTNSKELVGKTCFVKENILGVYSNHITRIRADNSKLNQKYLSIMLHYLWVKGVFLEKCHKWVGQAGINNKALLAIQIPLPPLEIQEKIVAELDDYQKIIDGAKQVVENYKPTIKIDPDWPMVELGEMCELVGGGTPLKSEKKYWKNGEIKWISAKHIDDNSKIVAYDLITKSAVEHSSTNIIPRGSVIFVTRVSVGKIAVTDDEYAINQDLTGIMIRNADRVLNNYLFYLLRQLSDIIANAAQGLGVKGVTRKYMANFKVPLPPLETQQKIVAEIESERNLVEANKKLIKIFEKKIKDKIGKVWEE